MKDILTPPKNGQLMVVSCHMGVDYEMRILFDKMITSELTKDDKLVIFFQTDGGSCSQVHPIRQIIKYLDCLLYTSPSPRDRQKSRMPSSA